MRPFICLMLIGLAGCGHPATASKCAAPAAAAAPAGLAKLAKNRAASAALVFKKGGKNTAGSGVVVTPRHVLTSPGRLAAAADDVLIRVVGTDGRPFQTVMRSYRSNPDLDIALIETRDPLPVEPVGWSNALPDVGEAVYMVDYFAAEFMQTVHNGSVSFRVADEEHTSFFLFDFDAQVSKSSVGAGVFNLRGNFCGLLLGPAAEGASGGQALAASEIFEFMKVQKGLAPGPAPAPTQQLKR